MSSDRPWVLGETAPGCPAEERERIAGLMRDWSSNESPPTGYVEEARRTVAGKHGEYLRWLEARS